MTTIAALKNNKTNETVFCHDWRIVTTTHLLCSDSTTKLIRFKHFALLWCGSVHLKTLIEYKHKHLFDNLKIINEEDVLWFYQIYFENVLSDPIAKVWDTDSEKRHTADFIIITQNNIYSLNSMWEFNEIPLTSPYAWEITLHTNGSGWDTVRDFIEGYLASSRFQDFSRETMEQLLRAGAEYAGRRVINCNSNITTYWADELFVKNLH